MLCRAIGCDNPVTDPSQDFCSDCQHTHYVETDEMDCSPTDIATPTLAERKPHRFHSVEHLTEVDVFAVHQLFAIQDPSGALQYASRKSCCQVAK